MKTLRQRLAFLFWFISLNALGCGPFFPDTVLDLPQAALRVRGSCMFDEMIAIDRSHGRKLSLRLAGLAMIRHSQNHFPKDWAQLTFEDQIHRLHIQILEPVIAAGIPAELAEKMELGARAARTEAIELALVLLENKTSPTRVVEIVNTFTSWRSSLPEIDVNGPWGILLPPRAEIPAPPDIPEVPLDIAAYWSAARAWRSGDSQSARAAWQAILDLPDNERRHRAVWAAWMLAKTSPDETSSVPFYKKTVALAESGYRDALGLSSLAMGWLAMTETDPVAKLIGYFEAACAGEEIMLISLRLQLSNILKDEAAMARAAADPLAREVVTALRFTMHLDPRLPNRADAVDKGRWLELLEKHNSVKPSPAAAKAAWICYGSADFEAARRWLAQAPPDAGEILWLRAKLALRDGRMDEAARLFAKAAPIYQFSPDEEVTSPGLEEMLWHDHASRRDWMRGQFHSDRAIVHIGRGEFLRAMSFLAQAGYHEDAAYLAERVLTTDELVSWVKQHRPAPPEDNRMPFFRLGAHGRAHAPDGPWQGDKLRYLLARRLAREFRFREAAEFMPSALRPLFNHYVRLHREAKSGAWPAETKAVILWNLASLRRHLGMELFGYDGAPDNTHWDGSYTAIDFAQRRLMKNGWYSEWARSDEPAREAMNEIERAFPVISREEIQRLAKHRASSEQRFHYRYDAAEIAWRAAAMLPDHHPSKLYILHEAGRWLAGRDPQAADRFYQEIIRRCGELPQGRDLDRRRWFLPHAPDASVPDLPTRLRFYDPDIAANTGIRVEPVR